MATCVLNLGLKSVRAALFDDSGNCLEIAYQPIETRMGEGRVEQAPDEWWRSALDVMARVLNKPEQRLQVDLVTVTASAGCLVVLDAQGDPLRNAIMISDVRARPQAERIAASPRFLNLGLPGARVTPDLMLPKIVWLRENEPETFGRARWFASPNDFLVHRLTGEMMTDAHNASKLLSDPLGHYPADLISELLIDPATLPPVAQAAEAILPLRHEVREILRLPPRTRVVLTTYDAICAVYGSGVAEEGDACDVSGTVSSFRAVTRFAGPDPSGRLFTTAHVRPGLYLAGGSNNLGGGVIEWAKQVLYPGAAEPYNTMVTEACDAPPGAAGLIFLPYLLGERAPIWDPAARGVFFGLGRNHTRSDMIRAVFEGVGYSVMDIADRLSELGVQIHRASASGGLARLEPINQIKADMLGVPVQLTAELETTALGSALLAGVTIGRWPTIEDAVKACVRFQHTYEPEPARTEMYRDFFAIYRSLYDRLRDLFQEREGLIAQHSEVLRTALARTENL
jgi:xylulokinase